MNYPYECSEQLSSKLISFVVFKDMLPLIHKRKRKESDKDLAPTPENIGTLVKEIINTLADRKDSQGNFGYLFVDFLFLYLINLLQKDIGRRMAVHMITLACSSTMHSPLLMTTTSRSLLLFWPPLAHFYVLSSTNTLNLQLKKRKR